jgi:hypothetical protein
MSSKQKYKTTRKPASLLWKPLEIKGWGLFSSVAKAMAALATLKWESAVAEALKAVDCVTFKDDPRGLAWSLVYRAMTRAVIDLISAPESSLSRDQIERARARALDSDAELAAVEVVIDDTFFAHPGWSTYCRAVTHQLRSWLVAGGLGEERAGELAWHLPGYFTAALSREWLANRTYLASLTAETFRTPFTPAEEQDLAWSKYAGWLHDQANRRLFEEEFGFMDVYVPLRAYVEAFEGSGKLSITVQMVEKLLDAWMDKASPADPLRVVEGDPGAGKSSLARAYGATRFGLRRGGRHWRVIYVPLHHPALDLGKPLDEAVAGYCNSIGVSLAKPLDIDAPDPTLLILDGLDELSKAGQVGERIIHAFVSEVNALLTKWNYGRDPAQLLALLCGRPVAVDAIKASVRTDQGLLNLLPYMIERDELHYRLPDKTVKIIDPQGLLKIDQRLAWWSKYGAARGRGSGEEAYKNLRSRHDLAPITAQPLLNYLVAFLASPSGDLSGLPANLAAIYERLLRRIWERGWEQRHQVPALAGFSYEQFVDLLEVVALTAWHAGNTRSIRARQVEERLEAHQKTLLAGLEQTTSAGVIRLLLGFFFRPMGREEGERTYEFTHKAFAEYLVSRRLVRQVAELAADWHQAFGTRLWNPEEALIRWAKVFGPVQFGTEIWEFVAEELAERPQEDIKLYQDLVAYLLGVVVREDMPMHSMVAQLGHAATYKEMNRQALNSEHAFLRMLGACAGRTQSRSRIPELANELPRWLGARWGDTLTMDTS